MRANGEEEKPVPKQSKSGVARYPEVDAAVGMHVDARAAQGLATSPDELHALALDVAVKSGHHDFKASAKWIDNVSQLFGICLIVVLQTTSSRRQSRSRIGQEITKIAILFPRSVLSVRSRYYSSRQADPHQQIVLDDKSI
jgi:hypothetical protein